MHPDVIVVGGGPAGRALAAACGRRHLHTVLLDSAPQRPWSATYGCWAAELPAALPGSVVAARVAGRAIALTEHHLGRDYAVLDVAALRSHLDAELVATDVTVRPGRAVGNPEPGVVALADGTTLRAAVVVDTGGRAQPLHRGRGGALPAEQTAYGLVVGEPAAEPLIAPGEALFMDWRRDHGEAGWPTFLYGIPLGAGQVLLEETSLARRPGLALPVLRRRLLARLARHGISVPPDARAEKVHFPVDRSRHRSPAAVGFGAAAPLTHPATGFSLASSLQLAPAVAAAFAAHLPADPTGALAAARATVWSPAARAVHRFRLIGLEALLRMPPAEVPAFFEVFFTLPERHRWSYLTGRADVPATLATMGALFGRAGWPLRARLVGPALRPALRTNGAPNGVP